MSYDPFEGAYLERRYRRALIQARKQEERETMATKEEGVPCYDNAKPDEPVFVLRAQDQLAPEIVREWAYRAQSLGTPVAKVVEAQALADKMEEWQIANVRKVPD